MLEDVGGPEVSYIENWKDGDPEKAQWSFGPSCGPYGTFEDSEIGALEDAAWC